MNIIRAILGWIVPAVILGAGIAAFFFMGSQPPPARKSSDVSAATAVRTVEATPEVNGLTIEADGVVVPLREVTLAAEVGGRVLTKATACNEGQFVKAGTLLFEIDRRDYELDVDRLDREFKQAGLAIEELDEELVQNGNTIDLARRQVELARREAARLENLKAGKIVTESEHDRSLREELTATNLLTTAEGQKRVLAKRRNRLLEAQSLASTMLDKAKLDLSRTRIVAPIDGIVVDDKVEQDSFVAKGTPLVTLEDTSSMEVKTSLRMDELAQVWGGRVGSAAAERGTHDLPETPVKVVFNFGGHAYEWDGVLSRQEGRGLDEKTRTLPCRVRVSQPREVRALDRYGAVMQSLPPEAPRSLMRNMFVEVRVQVDTPQPLLSVPQEVVRPSGDLYLMRDGRLVIARPRPFHSGDGRVVFEEIESGLLPTDRVVTSQLSNPRDGMELVEAAP